MQLVGERPRCSVAGRVIVHGSTQLLMRRGRGWGTCHGWWGPSCCICFGDQLNRFPYISPVAVHKDASTCQSEAIHRLVAALVRQPGSASEGYVHAVE